MKLRRSQMPDLTALQAFDAAARLGSFTRAAVELNLTQSAVSRQIKELECQLGIELFVRVRQRIVLSEAGQRLRPEIEGLLGQVEALTLRAASARDVTGALTISCLPTFGSRWLVPRLPGFLAQYPGLQASVVSRNDSFDMVAAGVDLAVHYGKPAWPGAGCTYLCAETMLAVAAPSLLGDGTGLPDEVTLLHLDQRPMLWPEWLAARGGDVARGFRGHRLDQFGLLIEAAVAGLGAALLPSYLIERELAQGALVRIAGAALTTDTAYWVAIPDEHAADPLCQHFLRWIVARVGRGDDAAPAVAPPAFPAASPAAAGTG